MRVVGRKILLGWLFGLLQELRSSTSSQYDGNQLNLHIPMPNFTDITGKVDCWRKNWKIGDGNNEVSGAISCIGCQMYGRNLTVVG
jgi:hypothetical protein